jgi:hypothetical protein
LEQALAPGWHGDRAAGRATRHVELLREVAREITPDPDRDDPPASGDEAHTRLKDLVSSMQDEAPRSGLGATTGAFVDHLAGVAERYGRNLFHCFDDQRIPSTTNKLEGFFGVSKSHIRSSIGAASTSNGVAQNLGADYLEALDYVRSQTHEEAVASIAAVTIDEYRAAREAVDIHEQPARLRRSRRRDAEGHLVDILDWWFSDDGTLRS